MKTSPRHFNSAKLLAFVSFASLGITLVPAQLTPTLNYVAPADSTDGEDGLWEDSASNGHDFLVDPGVVYNGSPADAPSGIVAVYSFDGSGNRRNSRAAWGQGNHMENISSGNPSGQSATFECVFRADTDTRREILWEFGGSGRGVSMTLNEGLLQFSENNTRLTVSTSVEANVFYHAVGILDFDGDLMSLYLNGAEPVSVAYPGTDWSGNDGGTDGALGGQEGSTVGGQTTENGIGAFASFDGDIALFRLYSDQVATPEQVAALFAATGIEGGPVGARALTLEIVPSQEFPDRFDFSWSSQTGKTYDLVSSLDLSTEPSSWTVWQGNEGVPSDGTVTSLTGVEAGSEPKRFFAILERDP